MLAMWSKALRVIPRVSKEEWNQLDVISKCVVFLPAQSPLWAVVSGGPHRRSGANARIQGVDPHPQPLARKQ